jgi:MOSC domain-containing protein
MRVAALYRYPVKGFRREECESLSVLDTGRIAGDRVLGVRFANAEAVGDAWGTKHEFVALVNTPGLARLLVEFDHRILRLRIGFREEVLVDEALDGASRRRIAAAIEEYVLQLAENPLSAHPDRLPLRLVGDGLTPRYQDSEPGYITLHGRASFDAVAAAAGVPNLSEDRFRSNIAIEGAGAWEEQTWVGRKIRIGEVEFEAVKAKARCLATHANPMTGDRDVPIMQILLKVFRAERPTFAIAMTTNGRGGTIHVGDDVTVGG